MYQLAVVTYSVLRCGTLVAKTRLEGGNYRATPGCSVKVNGKQVRLDIAVLVAYIPNSHHAHQRLRGSIRDKWKESRFLDRLSTCSVVTCRCQHLKAG